MIEEDFILTKNAPEKKLSRRSLMRGAAGTLAGAGLSLGAGLPAFADVADGRNYNKCVTLARPIPHITGPGHFFFPGPPDGSAPPSYPNYPFAGFDPSTVTDFEGVIASVDLTVDGKGTDLETGTLLNISSTPIGDSIGARSCRLTVSSAREP